MSTDDFDRQRKIARECHEIFEDLAALKGVSVVSWADGFGSVHTARQVTTWPDDKRALFRRTLRDLRRAEEETPPDDGDSSPADYVQSSASGIAGGGFHSADEKILRSRADKLAAESRAYIRAEFAKLPREAVEQSLKYRGIVDIEEWMRGKDAENPNPANHAATYVAQALREQSVDLSVRWVSTREAASRYFA